MGGVSVWQLMIIALIVVLLFGTNKLKSLGADLGASLKGFKKALGEEDSISSSKNTGFSMSQSPDLKVQDEGKDHNSKV